MKSGRGKKEVLKRQKKVDFSRIEEVYLAGPIQGDDCDGVNWRKDITSILHAMELTVLDPCVLEKVKTGMTVKKTKVVLKKHFKSGKHDAKFDNLMDRIIDSDINYISRKGKDKRAIIAYFPAGVSSGGTVSELWHAGEIAKIPIFWVIDRKEIDTTSYWVYRVVYRSGGSHFWSFDELFKFLRKVKGIKNGKKKNQKKE